MSSLPTHSHPAAPSCEGRFLLPAATLWHRELIRFLRQPSRIAGLVAAPLLFWLFIGSGFGSSFQPASAVNGGGYLQYFFPGTVVMIVLFTSIFSNMSTIEDRRDGFLLSVLASPISRSSLAAGKILGGATQAMVPGVLFLLLAPLAGFPVGWEQAASSLGVLFLIALSLTGLGFAIAWRMDSVQGFHAVLNLVLMPLWLLSGALFPPSGASDWIRWVMWANPLTYEVSALRQALSGSAAGGIGASASVQVTLLFCIITSLLALRGVGRPSIRQLG